MSLCFLKILIVIYVILRNATLSYVILSLSKDEGLS